MLTRLFACICLITNSHAEIIINSDDVTPNLSSTITDATPSSSQFDVENELTKISTSCFSSRDYELLAGDFVKHGTARMLSYNLLSISAMSIGMAELRRALNFAPLSPWKPYNSTEPSEDELASAPSIEAYYDLIEPISSVQSLDNQYFFEENITTAIAYIDKRLPSFRSVFRGRFEEMRLFNDGLIDRKLCDSVRNELLAIHDKIEKAISKMRSNDYKCLDSAK